jgi:hypothetical protein
MCFDLPTTLWKIFSTLSKIQRDIKVGIGTGVSFPAVKRPGRGVNSPPDLVPRLKKE